MVKIPLKVTKDRIFLASVICALKYKIPFRPIEFCVDTGSPETYISYGIARILNLPLASLSESEKIICIGGIKCKPLVMKNVSLYLKDENGKSVKFDIPEIYVLNPTSKKQDSLNQAQSISSILGLDFLRERKFKFFCDMANDTSYLED